MTSSDFISTIPTLEAFGQVGETDRYVVLPDDWWLGLSDVIDSTTAVSEGRYKAVNMAGAATIAAVSNAVGHDLPLFVFTGDGARFAMPADHVDTARGAMVSTAAWVKENLNLTLRVGLLPVSAIREAGHETKVAFHKPAPNVRYALFSGGGLDWAERQLKDGKIDIETPGDAREADLSGMSCQWGAMKSRRGTILSIVVRPTETADPEAFAALVNEVVRLIETGGNANPVPPEGPPIRWPGANITLDAQARRRGRSLFLQKLKSAVGAVVAILLFKTNIRLGAFKPETYRREVAENSDFRKFDDGLMMTVDCTRDAIRDVEKLLENAEKAGLALYGLHTQDEALMTCYVPTITMKDHVHFIDGAGGGYTEAMAAIKRKMAPVRSRPLADSNH